MSITLSAFLREKKDSYLRAVQDGEGREWTIVTGNEAGDLDSLASAIAYAWFASKVHGAKAVPLTQTPRSELHLRAENQHALELAKLNPETDILCIDDVPLGPESAFPSSTFALVDHNRLHARFTRSNPDAKVVAVVDHHQDEGLYRDTADPRLIVVPTGSCASLVARLFEEHASASGSVDMPAELASLLLCSILIDTSGLKPGGKAEEADIQAARFLIPRVGALPADVSLSAAAVKDYAPHETPGIQELHAVLQEKKASVAHLGTLDLLKRDYKDYTMTPVESPGREIRVGLSTVPVGFAEWLPRHEDFWSQTEKFMADRELTVLGILTSFRDSKKANKHGRGKHRREQMYVVRGDKDLAVGLFEALEEAGELGLKRKKFPDYGVHNGFGEEFRARVWKQKNVDATRKVTAPLVKTIIEGRAQSASL